MPTYAIYRHFVDDRVSYTLMYLITVERDRLQASPFKRLVQEILYWPCFVNGKIPH